MDSDRGFVTPIEISEELGIGLKAAYNLIKAEGFPAIPIGDCHAIPRQAFMNWISNPVLIAEFKKHIRKEAEARE